MYCLSNKMVSNLYTGTFDTSETWAISEHFCFFAFWGVHVRVEVLFLFILRAVIFNDCLSIFVVNMIPQFFAYVET